MRYADNHKDVVRDQLRLFVEAEEDNKKAQLRAGMLLCSMVPQVHNEQSQPPTLTRMLGGRAQTGQPSLQRIVGTSWGSLRKLTQGEEDLRNGFRPHPRLVKQHAPIGRKVLPNPLLATLEADGPPKHDEEQNDGRAHREVGLCGFVSTGFAPMPRARHI